MRKALLIVAMLLLVTPVMATTTISAVQGTQFTASDGNKVQPVSITYTSTVDIRAFALDINIASDGNKPNFQGIRGFKTGESNGAMVGGTSGYGIFPGRFRDFIVVTGPNWVDTNYNPTTAWEEPGTMNHHWGMGYPQMIVEMGTLYAGDANKPALSGTLFTFDVNNWGATGTFHLTIAPDTLRAGTTGVIGSDGNTVTPVTFVGTDITFAGGQPDCLYVGRVFDANTAGFTGLTVTQAMVDRWVILGKPNCWCCTSQKRGNGVYTGGSASKTDISDLAAVKNVANYNKVTTAANACLDFNFSGKVDITDLARVKNAANYNKVTGYGPPCK